MSVQVWFVNDDVSVEPGSSVKLSVAVENASDTTESYSVVPAGMTAAWLQVSRSTITVFAGSRDVVEVEVKPPALPTTSAGPTSVAVQVIAHTDNEITASAETAIEVESFDDRRITLVQPVLQARRRATFDCMVENHGNGLANCRMQLVDLTDRTDGTFDPPAVGIAPGGSELVKLKVRVRGGRFRRSRRQLEFGIEGTEVGRPPGMGRGMIIQPPTVSGRALGRLALAALVVGAVVAAWFGVIRPELRDAADRAVEDSVEDLTGQPPTEAAADTATTVPLPVDAGGSVPLPPSTPTEGGDPFAFRLPVNVSIDSNRSEAFDLPPDQRFELTDLVLQNPNGDLGRAELRRGSEVLYVWDLGSIASANEFQPRVTPLPFEPGDSIVLSATCEVVGSPTGTGCEVAVLVGGMLYPADQG